MWALALYSTGSCAGVCLDIMGPAEDWMKNPIIANRASVGRLAIIARDTLSKGDLICNVAVLIPIVKHLGLRPSIDMITNEIQRFFDLGRAPGAQPVKRNMSKYRCSVGAFLFMCLSMKHRGNTLIQGECARTHTWICKRLISMFGRAARRGHYPRHAAIRKMHHACGIPLPDPPSTLEFIMLSLGRV